MFIGIVYDAHAHTFSSSTIAHILYVKKKEKKMKKKQKLRK